MLSNEPDNYSNGRFRRAGEARGHRVECLPPRVFVPDIAGPGPSRLDPSRFDVVLPRRGSAFTAPELAVVQAFEDAGATVMNAAAAIARAQDKMGTLEQLARHGLPVPRTALLRDPSDVDKAWPGLGPAPLVLKPVIGTHGTGVTLVASAVEARTLVRHAGVTGRPLLLQEFVREAGGSDLRLFVVGDDVVAAMRRRARAGEFRANFHAGGRAEPYEATTDQRRLAVDAAHALGLDVAGVDLLESARGPLVVEVNSGPGFQALEHATGVDVAGAVLAMAEARAGRGRA